VTPARFLRHIIWPGLIFASDVAGRDLGGAQAEVMLLAIAGQESNLTHRFQLSGPARGFWQFERDGGLMGVLRHKATARIMGAALHELGIWGHGDTDFDDDAWDALPYSELLQVTAARCLLLSDPKPLPEVGDEQLAWAYYLRNWRPGKPHCDAWAGHYRAALAATRD
jgi:hypothetical protein